MATYTPSTNRNAANALRTAGGLSSRGNIRTAGSPLGMISSGISGTTQALNAPTVRREEQAAMDAAEAIRLEQQAYDRSLDAFSQDMQTQQLADTLKTSELSRKLTQSELNKFQRDEQNTRKTQNFAGGFNWRDTDITDPTKAFEAISTYVAGLDTDNTIKGMVEKSLLSGLNDRMQLLPKETQDNFAKLTDGILYNKATGELKTFDGVTAPTYKLSKQDEEAYDRYVSALESGQGIYNKQVDLINRVGGLNLPSGVLGSVNSTLNSILGTQDETSAWRTEFTNLINSQVIQSLPAGVASDRDIAIAREGFPDKFANKAQLQQFLTGAAKLQAYQNAYDEFALNYIENSNKGRKGLTAAWNEKMEDQNFVNQLNAGIDQRIGSALGTSTGAATTSNNVAAQALQLQNGGSVSYSNLW